MHASLSGTTTTRRDAMYAPGRKFFAPAPCGHTSCTRAVGIAAAVDALLAGARVDLGHDVVQAEIDREHELARARVDGVVDADLAGRQHDAARHAVDGQVDDLPLERPVEIPLVVRKVLEVPDERAGVGIHGQRRVRVERVARRARRVRLAAAGPCRRCCRCRSRRGRSRVVAARRPDRRAAALLERNAVPALVAGLAGFRDRAEPPRFCAGLARRARRSAARRSFAATPVPVVPIMTLPRATSGPPFKPSRRRKSPTFVSQTTAPVATSSATTCTSDVPR